MDDIFETFILDRQYEKDITPKTEAAHRQAWQSLKKICPAITITELDSEAIVKWQRAMKESKLRPNSINCYARSLNAFFNWLYEHDYLEEKLKIKKKPVPVEVVNVVPEKNIRALLDYRPTTFGMKR